MNYTKLTPGLTAQSPMADLMQLVFYDLDVDLRKLVLAVKKLSTYVRRLNPYVSWVKVGEN